LNKVEIERVEIKEEQCPRRIDAGRHRAIELARFEARGKQKMGTT
jgi:hypothetical protein